MNWTRLIELQISSFYNGKACTYLNDNMPPEDGIDDALNNFRNGGDELQAMLNVSFEVLVLPSMATGFNFLSIIPQMLDTRGVKKRSVESLDTVSALNSLNDSVTSNNVVPSPLKAPAKPATRGRGSRGGRGAARGGTTKTNLSTTVSNLIAIKKVLVRHGKYFRDLMEKHRSHQWLLCSQLPARLTRLNEPKQVVRLQHERVNVLLLRVEAISHNILMIRILNKV